MANSLLRLTNVNKKTPRMSHRFSLKFRGLDAIMGRVQRNQLTNITSFEKSNSANNGAPVTGTIYQRLFYGAHSSLDGADIGPALQSSLELSLLSVSVPSIEMETVEVSRFHDTAKHISKFSTMGEMNVTFYDYVDGSASAIMFMWQSLVGDKRTGAISYKQEYLLDSARLIEYGPKAPAKDDGSEIILAEHEVVNIYPKTIELGEHSYESAEVRKIQVTFTIDNIYPLYYVGSDQDTDYQASKQTSTASNPFSA
jgi:hypothetical protein